MNLDSLVISRSGYTFLDYLSDIGGMGGMLLSCAAGFLAFWNHNMLYDSMIKRLFKLRPKRSSKSQSFHETQEALEMKAHCFFNQVEFLREILPSWLCCCKLSR